MKNLIVFGGTGMTGEETVLYAISKGYNVRILVRDNKTIPETIKDKVNVINGDVTKYEDVEKALEGQDGVVVVLGTRNKLDPTAMMTEGMKNIAQGMKKHGLKKVSVCLSSFQFMEPDKVPKIMGNVNDDHSGMFAVLKENMDLEWRALCPPHISNNGPLGDLKTDHEKSLGRMVSKQDLAKCLVDSLEQPEHIHKRVGMITVPRE